MFKFKQAISILLTLVLLVGIVPTNSSTLAEEITDDQTQTDAINEENIKIVENNEKTLEIQTEVSIDNTTNATTDDTTNVTTDDTTNATVSLSLDKGTNEFTVTSIETDSQGNQVEKEYKVDVENATEDGIVATFTDMGTGEKYELNTNELHASFAFLIPIGVIIGEALLEHLIAIGLAAVIAGVTYTVASSVSETLRKKQYDHYPAYIDKKKDRVMIGNKPLTLDEAASRLKGAPPYNDVWSTDSVKAFKVAAKAGNGKPPIHDSAHGGEGYLPHWHIYNRSGGHSFY
ncbi:SAR2788 family putative toxin [Thermaerobacillus caldiproteolyticus]|uniref:SAR2788 family putative toxin n=1 Tax=Thermaerobacillus caldiproteolyticus TaxID=247480 RepID=UPI0018F1DCED|nr:SAR2788 family putative toxin [Anoxybacillus caldiproteolyticus]